MALTVCLYVCIVFCAPHLQPSCVCKSALLGMQPLHSMPNTTLLCLSTVNKSSFWQLTNAKSKRRPLDEPNECVTAGACHLCLSHQGTRQLPAQVSGVRVSQQGLLARLGHSVLSTRLVQTLTRGQQLSVGLPHKSHQYLMCPHGVPQACC